MQRGQDSCSTRAPHSNPAPRCARSLSSTRRHGPPRPPALERRTHNDRRHPMTDTDLVLIDHSERIATITLNRPEARNALSGGLIRDLRRAVADAQASEDIDVLILTGQDPAFCAGLDLKELGSGDSSLASTAPEADTPVSDRGPLP